MADHEHHRDGPEDCYGCRLKGVNVGKPYDFATRTPSRSAPRTPNPAWERGIARDERGMVILDEKLAPMSVKKYAEKKHLIEENRRRLRQDPQALSPTRS